MSNELRGKLCELSSVAVDEPSITEKNCLISGKKKKIRLQSQRHD